jgi:ferredoxin--NADP+ reductase
MMICGSPGMLTDLVAIVGDIGFAEGNSSRPGHYVIEKAFVEK